MLLKSVRADKILGKHPVFVCQNTERKRRHRKKKTPKANEDTERHRKEASLKSERADKILDNAYDPDVNAKDLWIDWTQIKDKKCLTFMDNGAGLDYNKMLKMLSFGYSDKKTIRGHVPVGMYGNGFKSGSMRLGKDVIVFSKTRDTMSVGLLSQTYLAAIEADNIVVPIVSVKQDGEDKISVEPGHRDSLEAILEHSLFKTEKELLEELQAINTMPPMVSTGTRIIIWNLRRSTAGQVEFDLTTNRYDIRIPHVDSGEVNNHQETSSSSEPESRTSLRAYCSILYLKPRMQIIIRGQKVRTQLLSKSLAHTRKDRYTPRFLKKKHIPITFGYNTKVTGHYGLMMYNKNRLIRAYERVGCQRKANGVGIIGIIECDFLSPTHNKQDFDDTEDYRKVKQKLGEKLEEYWKEMRHTRRKKDPNCSLEIEDMEKSPDQNWAQCESCEKWRKLPDGIDASKLPLKWFCYMNPNPQFRNCLAEEELEDSEDEQPYQKTYKKEEKQQQENRQQNAEGAVPSPSTSTTPSTRSGTSRGYSGTTEIGPPTSTPLNRSGHKPSSQSTPRSSSTCSTPTHPRSKRVLLLTPESEQVKRARVQVSGTKLLPQATPDILLLLEEVTRASKGGFNPQLVDGALAEEQWETASKERDQYRDLVETANQEREQYKEQMKTANQERDRYRDLVETANQDRDQYREQMETANQERDRYRDQVETANQERDRYRDQVENANQERDQYTDQVETANRERDRYRDQVETANQERDQYTDQVETANRERDRYRDQVETANQERDQYRDQVETAKQDRDRYRDQVETANQERDQYRDQVETAKQDRDRYRDQVKTANQERDQYRDQVETANRERDRYRDQVETANQERDQYRDQVETAKQDRDRYRDQVETANRERDQYRDQVETAKQDRDRYKDQVDTANQDRDRYKAQVDNLIQQLQKMRTNSMKQEPCDQAFGGEDDLALQLDSILTELDCCNVERDQLKTEIMKANRAGGGVAPGNDTSQSTPRSSSTCSTPTHPRSKRVLLLTPESEQVKRARVQVSGTKLLPQATPDILLLLEEVTRASKGGFNPQLVDGALAEEQWETASKERDQYRDLVETANQEREQYKEQMKTANQERDRYRDLVETANQDRDQYRDQVENANQERDQYTDQVETANRERDRYRDQVETANQERDQYTDQVETANRERDRYRDQVETANQERDQYRDQVETAKQDRDRYRDQVETANQERDQYRDQVETAKQDRDRYRDQVKTANQERDQYRDQVETANRERDRYRDQVETANQERDQYTDQVETAKQDRDRYRDQVETANRERDQYRDQVETAKQDRDRYKDQVDTANQDRDRYKAQVDNLIQQLQKMRTNSMKQEPCDQAFGGEDDLALQLDSILTELDCCNVERDQLKTELESLEAEKEAVFSQCEQLKKELDDLREAGTRATGPHCAERAGNGPSTPVSTETERLKNLRLSVSRLLVILIPELDLEQINYDSSVIEEILDQYIDGVTYSGAS